MKTTKAEACNQAAKFDGVHIATDTWNHTEQKLCHLFQFLTTQDACKFAAVCESMTWVVETHVYVAA